MPITATLEPLPAVDASPVLCEQLSRAAWIVLVETADRDMLECLRGVTAPILVVELDQSRLEERARVAADIGIERIMLIEQLVGAKTEEVSWYRYNDSRLNGIKPLPELKPKYPNLALEAMEVREQISLAQLLLSWEPALPDGGVLVLPDSAESDWLDGAIPCLQRLRALCWLWDESWTTQSQQQLDGVLADCWLTLQSDEAMHQSALKVWRRDDDLHFRATVLVERDALINQVSVLEGEKASLVTERDGVMLERDALSNQVTVLEGEKASLVAERDGVMLERDALSNQVTVLEGEKASLVTQRDGVMLERDALSNQVAVLEGEKASLVTQRDGVMLERDALSNQVAALEGRMATINNELDDLLALINQCTQENINHDEAR